MTGAPFDVERARADVPAAIASVYLNAGTFGPLPRQAAEAMKARVEESLSIGRIGTAGFERWQGVGEEARAAFARALGRPPREIALQHCTTDGINAVVWGLDLREGDEVLTTTHEHPGLTAPLEELARRRGVVVREVDPRPASWVDAMTSRTKLVAISHALWTSGDVLPIEEISAAAHERGAVVLVDGAQAAGAFDVDPSILGCDFYTVSGQKWLCGPSGTGALWIRAGAEALLGTPWPAYFSRDRGPHGVRDWDGARRLDATTLSSTSLAGATAALGWHAAQVERGAHAWARELAVRLRARLARSPRVTVIDAARPSQLVSFTVDGEGASRVAARLEASGILLRAIPGVSWVRAAVGFWNTEEDLDRLVSALDRVN